MNSKELSFETRRRLVLSRIRQGYYDEMIDKFLKERHPENLPNENTRVI